MAVRTKNRGKIIRVAVTQQKKKNRWFKWICYICIIVGLTIFVAEGLCLMFNVFNTFFRHRITEKRELKKGSDSYQEWVSPPSPSYFQVYVLDVLNPQEVIQTGAKPILEERGPYTYRVKREKVNVTYENAGRIISYREKKWYYFQRNMSVGRSSDKFTTINLPMLTLANIARFEPLFVRDVIQTILDATGEQLFIKLSVGEILWGYEDKLLKDLKAVMARFGVKFPLDDKFGLFYNKNGSDDGLYRIKSGLGNTIDQLAQIVSWNGNRSLDYWNSEITNSLNGSDGTVYPPFVNKSRPLYLFSTDACRSLEFEHTHGRYVKSISVDRFAVPSMAVANVSVNPYNRGFCTPSTNCLPAGLLNISVCRNSAPMILSLPHFLDADPDVCNHVIGMKPSRLEHQSVIDIEPETGMVMYAAKRLQLNAFLTNISGVKDMMNLTDVVLPILWLNESVAMDDKGAQDLRRELDLQIAVTFAQVGLIMLGAMLLHFGSLGCLTLEKGWCKLLRKKQPTEDKKPATGSA